MKKRRVRSVEHTKWHGVPVRIERVRGTINNDTPILPWAVAEAVVDDAQARAGMNLSNHLAAEKYLTTHAELVYARNNDFAKKIQSDADYGNAGRDWLYKYMEHWLASWAKKHAVKFYRALPSGYGWSR